ncbi:MAG TPA: glycosyltransferase family 39 protein, partial [bacterium]|nr:glycosyltransferase family 39 protein [bacterium]
MRKKKSPVRKKASISHVSRRVPLSDVGFTPLLVPDKRAWGLLLGWALTAFALFNSPSFRFLLPAGYPVSGIPFWPVYLLGLVLILYFFPCLGEDFPAPDLSTGTARAIFGVLMGCTAYQRLKDAQLLPSMAWDDHYIIISQVRSVLDYSDYHLLFGHDFRPPFVTYLMCGLWTLLPHETGIFIVRLASTLMDLGACWVLYLTGKELGGRRMGLVLMAMAAFSKTLLETTKYDLGIDEAALVAALVILFLLRVLRDPSLKHFLQLGAALGFTDYTYSTLRLFIPSVIVGTLIWILWDPAKRPRSRYGWVLGLGLGVSWSALFFTQNTSMAHSHPWLGFFTKGSGGLSVLALLAFCYYQVWRNRVSEGKIWEWASAVFFAGILLTPLWMDPYYSVENNPHLSNQALWGTYYHFTFPEIVA